MWEEWFLLEIISTVQLMTPTQKEDGYVSTGQLEKQCGSQDWNNKGSIISAEGLLYIYEEKNGNIALVKPNSEKLDIISSFRVTKGYGPYWAHPVIDKGRLFLRHGDYLAVYSLKAKLSIPGSNKL